MKEFPWGRITQEWTIGRYRIIEYHPWAHSEDGRVLAGRPDKGVLRYEPWARGPLNVPESEQTWDKTRSEWPTLEVALLSAIASAAAADLLYARDHGAWSLFGRDNATIYAARVLDVVPKEE